MEGTSGAHYALQVALQTMKERCQSLQKRMAILEEENLNLRIESSRLVKPSPIDNSDTVYEELQNQITQLSREKTKLTQHLHMVANENKKLWNRLSRATQTNQCLGDQLNKISDTLNQYPSASGKVYSELIDSTLLSGKGCMELSSDPLVMKNNLCTSTFQTDDLEIVGSSEINNAKGTNEESLEEISLKLINSILQEKSDLEDQYNQMIEIQNSSFDVEDMDCIVIDDSSIENEIKLHYENLVKLKESLKNQQSIMKNVHSYISRVTSDRTLCEKCQMWKDDRGPIDPDELELESLRRWSTPQGPSLIQDHAATVDDTLVYPIDNSEQQQPTTDTNVSFCPMCGKLFNTHFEEFHNHVYSHFIDEDNAPAICSELSMNVR